MNISLNTLDKRHSKLALVDNLSYGGPSQVKYRKASTQLKGKFTLKLLRFCQNNDIETNHKEPLTELH